MWMYQVTEIIHYISDHIVVLSDVVSDFSNVPYDNMQYQYINDVGKQWIRKYGLALCKELTWNNS